MHTYRNFGTDGRASVSGFTLTPVFGYSPGAPVQDLVIDGPFNGGMELSWTGEAGKFYGVDTNPNLTIESGWASWVTNLLGNGGTMSVTNTIGPDQTFYRVISE